MLVVAGKICGAITSFYQVVFEVLMSLFAEIAAKSFYVRA